MIRLAGFDAGQTRTRCRISGWEDGRWTCVGEGSGPGVSHLDAPQGEQRFIEAIRRSTAAAGHSSEDHPLTAAVIGSPEPMKLSQLELAPRIGTQPLRQLSATQTRPLWPAATPAEPAP